MTANDKTPGKSKIALTQRAPAEWAGDLVPGSGRLTVGSGVVDVSHSLKSRHEDVFAPQHFNEMSMYQAAHALCG